MLLHVCDGQLPVPGPDCYRTIAMPPIFDSNKPDRFVLPTPEKMVEFDKAAIANGVSSAELIDRAASAIAARVAAVAPTLGVSNVVILCGSGNNGADGLVAARLLHERGLAVTVMAIGVESYSADFKREYEKLPQPAYFYPKQSLSLPGQSIAAREKLREFFKPDTIIVDALLGTGLKGSPRRTLAEMITDANAARADGRVKYIVAVDTPSGVNGDTGQVFEPAIVADETVTFQFIKRGMVQYPTREFCGGIRVIDIGVAANEPVPLSLLEEGNLPRFKVRESNSHKGMLGHVLVIAGSKTMPGASALSALAALRTGAGLVTKFHAESWPVVAVPNEVMYLWAAPPQGILDLSCYDVLEQYLTRVTTVVIGPGIGTSPLTATLLSKLFKRCDEEHKTVVLDADGLNVVCEYNFPLPKDTISTPHPGEASRLLRLSAAEVQRDRYQAMEGLCRKLGGVVVLKGASTIVGNADRAAVCVRGNPYLATPGSGDVLSGIIAGLHAQGLPSQDAAALGVFVHAAAGDKAHGMSLGPITATDIINAVPGILGGLYDRGA